MPPSPDVAVISIRDSSNIGLSLDGWKASLVCVFADAEYTAASVANWGWRHLYDACMFLPQDAVRINAFLSSEAVRTASALFIHCHAGQSRSVAVGLHAASLLGADLECAQSMSPNKTVSLLLEDPWALGPGYVPPATPDPLLTRVLRRIRLS